MSVRKARGMVAGLALALAVLTCGTALWRSPPLARAVSGEATVSEGEETEFLLTVRNGEVCIYTGGDLLSNTGIPVRNLPRRDREELEHGIRARGERELAALLEDLGA